MFLLDLLSLCFLILLDDIGSSHPRLIIRSIEGSDPIEFFS